MRRQVTAGLVGRIAELERFDRILTDALAAAWRATTDQRRGRYRQVGLVAEIGSARKPAAPRLPSATATKVRACPAFEAWQELLDELANSTVRIDGLPTPFGDAAASRTAYELMQSVARPLIAASRQQPLILGVEDVHWADRDTLELLWFVGRQPEQRTHPDARDVPPGRCASRTSVSHAAALAARLSD